MAEAKHRIETAAIHKFIRHAAPAASEAEPAGRDPPLEGPCPVCRVGTMRVTRDGPHYAAFCTRGCGHASVLR